MSSGGLIAFEMASQLRSAGKTVSLLATLDTAVPLSERPPMQPSSLLPVTAADLGCRNLLETSTAPTSLAALVQAAKAGERLREGLASSKPGGLPASSPTRSPITIGISPTPLKGLFCSSAQRSASRRAICCRIGAT